MVLAESGMVANGATIVVLSVMTMECGGDTARREMDGEGKVGLLLGRQGMMLAVAAEESRL